MRPAGRAEAMSISTGLRGCAVHGPRKSGADHSQSASENAPPPSRTVANIHQRPPHSTSVASLATTPATSVPPAASRREIRRAIEVDRSGRTALRDHPHLAVALEHVGVGKMASGLQHRLRRAERPVGAELDRRNDALAAAVLEILDEQERAAAPDDRERVGVEAPAVVGQVAPAAVEPLAQPALAAPPADAPMRRMAQRLVDAVKRAATARATTACLAKRRGRQDLLVESRRRLARESPAGPPARRRRARLRSASRRAPAAPRSVALTRCRLSPPGRAVATAPCGPTIRTVGARPASAAASSPAPGRRRRTRPARLRAFSASGACARSTIR